MTRILIFVAVLFGMASSALASDLSGHVVLNSSKSYSWNGVWVGAGGGATFVNSIISVPVVDGVAVIDGLGANGWDGALMGGYDLQLGNAVFGIMIEGRMGNAKIEASYDTVAASVDVDYRFMGAVRIGIADGQVLFYGLGGWERMHVAGDGLLSGYSADFDGWTAGLGFEMQRGSGLTFGVEARYTSFWDETIESVSIEPEALTVTARVGYHF